MKRFFEAAKAWLTRLSTISLDFFLYWMLYPLFLAIVTGAGVWILFNQKQLSALAVNKVPKDERYIVLAFIGVAVILIALIYGVYVGWYKKRESRWPSHREILPLHRFLSFLFILPIVGVFGTKKIEDYDPIFATFLISVAAMACFPTFVEVTKICERITGGRPFFGENGPLRSGRTGRLLSYAPAFATFLIFLVFCYHFSSIAINGLQGLRTRTTDMAIYTNILYKSFHGDFLGCSIMRTGNHAAAHFDPILILFSPLYMLYPRPEFLAILQVVWLGFGIFPAFWLGRRVLENGWAGVVVGAIYALHPTVQQVSLFEFHSLALLGSPVLLAIFLIEARYYKRLFALLPFILLIREDVSLLMCFVGLSAILSNRKDAWVGVAVIFFSILYFVFIKFFFMGSSDMIMSGKGVYNYTYYFDFMMPHRQGVRGLLTSIVTNPVYSFRQLISMEKLAFSLRLLGPFLAIPVLAKKRRVMLLYSVVFLLLASKPAVFSNRFHYQIVAFPVLVGLFPFGIKRVLDWRCFSLPRNQFFAGLMGAILVAGVLHSVMFGIVVKEKTSSSTYAFSLNHIQKERFQEVMKMVAMIEPEASVTASYDVAPYVSNRMEIYSMNHYRPTKPTDYLFLDRMRTKREMVKEFDEQISDGIYKEIARYRQIVLYEFNPEKYKELNKKKKQGKAKPLKSR